MLRIQRMALQSVFKGTGAERLPPGRDGKMNSVLQQTPYQCDRCGTTNIVAAPLVYQQGTHSFSTRFSSGTTQSASAQTAAPPNRRGYGRPVALWSIPICFTLFWGLAGLGRILDHPQSAASLSDSVAVLLLLGMVCLGGMILNFRRVSRYNREVYPRLRWNWEHTYICRRCGRFLFIPS